MPRVNARRSTSFTAAIGLLALPSCVALLVISSCGGESKSGGGAVVPPGAGYGEELRVLSRDDCVALRDHQIEIAVSDALLADGGSPLSLDAGTRLTIESEVRAKTKASTDAWLKRCSGSSVSSRDLRCMREAGTIAAFDSCGEVDAGTTDATDAALGDVGPG